MRGVLQRVSRASVSVDHETVAAIGKGLLVLVAFQSNDKESDLRYMAEKIVNLRLFPDQEDKMNLSLRDTQGELLVVSQFTLYGDARKGRRPSYTDSAPADLAERLYHDFLKTLQELDVPVAAGIFQAHMEVELINDGPVTILLDSNRLF
ncbi:MAG: D-aminoacyl-tRNA deacylase [Symbiobacteriaceae bacterium]|nr:D-aminoacyl-tRNA deacylase [Symbiobacteriaceae bacterium]